VRNPVVPILLAVSLAGPVQSRAEVGGGPIVESEEQHVLDAEDAYVAAELSRDEAALRRIVDDRFVFNSSNGQTTGKEELIQALLEMAMTGQDVTERSVLIEGDVALVFGTTELRFAAPEGTERVSTLRYTSTYVRREGDWRLLALQMQARAPRQPKSANSEQSGQEPHDMKALMDFATRYAAAWSSQDPVVFAAFYAEDASFRINDGAASIGRAAIEETARSFMTAFPDMVVRLVELQQTEDHIEFHWHWTGTNTGPGGTGNVVDLRGHEQWILDEEGLILECHGHMDDAEYQRQLNAPSD
jgi:steroid delta-isomerase-like uncharacterized protein